jgi:hypothetical protein
VQVELLPDWSVTVTVKTFAPKLAQVNVLLVPVLKLYDSGPQLSELNAATVDALTVTEPAELKGAVRFVHIALGAIKSTIFMTVTHVSNLTPPCWAVLFSLAVKKA